MQNQSNYLITFDTQLKTTLLIDEYFNDVYKNFSQNLKKSVAVKFFEQLVS